MTQNLNAGDTAKYYDTYLVNYSSFIQLLHPQKYLANDHIKSSSQQKVDNLAAELMTRIGMNVVQSIINFSLEASLSNKPQSAKIT